MNKILNQLSLVIITLLFIGCSHDKKLSGDIFIVTQGGQNYKLGLVEVGLINEDTAKIYIKKKLELTNLKIQPFLMQYEILKDSIQKLESGETVRRQEAEIAGKKFSNGDLSWNQYSAILNRNIKYLDIQINLQNKIAPLSEIYNQYTSPEYFLADIPKYIDSTKTDADGHFSFIVDSRRRYYLIAATSRKVMENTEEYFWFLPYPNNEFKDNEKILLSNDNLFDATKYLKKDNKGMTDLKIND